MSDDQMMNAPEPVVPGEVPPPPAFVSAPVRPSGLTTSNVLMVAAAVLVLVAILGIVGWVVLGAQSFKPQQGATITNSPTAPTGQPGSAPATGALTPVGDVSNRDVFTPRDPFKPIPAPTLEADESDDSTESVDANQLVLTGFTTDDGERKAIVELGGTEYTVGEGDPIGESNYKVLEVNSRTIVVLFGDERVTLSVGTGTSK